VNDETRQVVRTLKLADSLAQQRASEIVRTIEGVRLVNAQGTRRLRISYDFTKLSWTMLCDTLVKAGLYSQGPITRWRDSWLDLLDHNMRENLEHKAACCSKPPPGAGRK